MKREFAKNHVALRPYTEIENAVGKLSGRKKMLIDPERLSYALYKLIPDETEMIEKENPEIIMKSVKNDIETEHIRRAHLKDAAAHTKFI